MRRTWVAALALAIALATVVPASSQNFAPAPPPPAPSPFKSGAPATICSTDYGWCPIQYAATAMNSPFCYCFSPPGSWVLGKGRYWPYDPATASPYLNPHTGPPTTLR